MGRFTWTRTPILLTKRLEFCTGIQIYSILTIFLLLLYCRLLLLLSQIEPKGTRPPPPPPPPPRRPPQKSIRIWHAGGLHLLSNIIRTLKKKKKKKRRRRRRRRRQEPVRKHRGYRHSGAHSRDR